MGTTARVWVRGTNASPLAHLARAELVDLESRWSRFIPDSELNACNRAAGSVIAVSEPTYEVLRRARSAWESTGGAFDVTVAPALDALGYDRSFELVASGTCHRRTAVRAPGSAGIRFLAGRR